MSIFNFCIYVCVPLLYLRYIPKSLVEKETKVTVFYEEKKLLLLHISYLTLIKKNNASKTNDNRETSSLTNEYCI